MKCLLAIMYIVSAVNGDTLKLSKVPGMEFPKVSLSASNISSYFLELLGVKVTPVEPLCVIVEDPFSYAKVLVVLEDGGSLDCLPSSVTQKIQGVVDWKKVQKSLKVVLNKTLGKMAAYYELPQKPQKSQEGELVKSSLVTLQKESEEIKTKINSVSNSKTVVWIKTIKSQDLSKQYCNTVQDIVSASSGKVLVGFISKEPVYTRIKRAVPETDKIDPRQKKKKLLFGTSRDFPVMFAIVSVTLLIFFLSVLVISIGIAKMDPGRDSIIYRMTSQRMKKEQ